MWVQFFETNVMTVLSREYLNRFVDFAVNQYSEMFGTFCGFLKLVTWGLIKGKSLSSYS